MTERGSRGSGNGGPAVSYVAKYDYPAQGVTAGQVFLQIGDIPPDIIVVPVPVNR